MIAYFTIPGSLLPWQRTRGGRTESAESKAQKEAIRWAWFQQMSAADLRAWPRDGFYDVTARFWWPDRKVRDVDNAQKMIGDALEGVAWENDRRIFGWRALRRLDLLRPRVDVAIRLLPEDPLEWLTDPELPPCATFT